MEETTADFRAKMKLLITEFYTEMIDLGTPMVLVLPKLTDYALQLCGDLLTTHRSLVLFRVGPKEEIRGIVCPNVMIQRKLNDSIDLMEDIKIVGSIASVGASSSAGIFKQPQEDEFWSSLNPIHLSEIYRTVGFVKLVKPKWIVFEYDMQISMPDMEYGSLVEMYGFPPEYKTFDIDAILAPVKTDVNIVWVDDTHILLVCKFFSVARTISQKIQTPLAKVRPILVASKKTKLKAIQNGYHYLPPKDRPKCVPTAARRLICKHLDLNLTPQAIELEEEETKVIRQAKAEREKRNTE